MCTEVKQIRCESQCDCLQCTQVISMTNFSRRLKLILISFITLSLGAIGIFTWTYFDQKNPPEVVNPTKDLLVQYSRQWGLGDEVIVHVSHDREYIWYVDQGSTGFANSSNCGPTSVEMVSRWYNPAKIALSSDLRKKYHPMGGWWYGADIENALSDTSIPFEVVPITLAEELVDLLDLGNILIVNNNMELISRNSNQSQRTGRFYEGVTGHYFVVKGYARVDHKLYFEVYDPFSMSLIYADTTYMGKNRYYLSDDLILSMEQWYPFVYVIAPMKNE